jgi:uncharacterized delta-60 repeat protein
MKLRPKARGLAFTFTSITIWIALSPSFAQVALDAFNPNVSDNIRSVAFQTNGQIIIGGYFGNAGGSNHFGIARINPDGSVDHTFTAYTGFGAEVVAVQENGKILIGGHFTSVNGYIAVNGYPINRAARLEADGNFDSPFNGGANQGVWTLAPLSDGGTFVGGSFGTLAGRSCRNIGKLTAEGALDPSFNAETNDQRFYAAQVIKVIVQPDGKILAGGTFQLLGTHGRTNFVRFNPDGTVDTTFRPPAELFVRAVVLQPDGKMVVGGNLASAGPEPSACVLRLNADGSVDPSFQRVPAEGFGNGFGPIMTVVRQPDGWIIVGGTFTNIAGQARNRLARLRPDGTLDSTFNPAVNGYVFSLALDKTGKLIVAGAFTAVAGQARNNIARLSLAPQLFAPIVIGTGQGAFRFSFSNVAQQAFTVLASTDLALPDSNWMEIGAATNDGAGIYQFTDSGATNYPRRFYKLSSP